MTSDGTITTVAGTTYGYSGDNGPAMRAQLAYPRAVAVDGQGRVMIADTSNNRIRRFVPGGNITTIVGTSYWGFSGDGGQASYASLYSPKGVAVDGKGVIYISDYGNQRIRMINTSGVITDLAGRTAGFAGDNLFSVNALLNYPIGIASDSAGNIYVADSSNYRVRLINTLGMISTIAGFGHLLR